MNQLRFPQDQSSQESITVPPLIYRIKQYQPTTLISRFSFMLIRPPRFMYNEQLLNPPENYQIRYKIQTHQIPFKLTLYKPPNMLYVILYLHGNSSSRFEGYMQLKQLPEGVGLACFDFNGCGMRFDSDYITLGSKQSKQVDIAAKYLKKLGHKVIGWGRSMGSVSLLLSQQVDILVADSPFCSLTNLCKQSTQKVTPSICCCFVHCFFPCLFSCVRSDVQQRAGFDLRQLEVAKIVAKSQRNKNRCLFIMAGSQDHMIHFSHSQKVYDSFPGKKQIKIFEGSHNSSRPFEVIMKCFQFIQQELGLKRQIFNKKNHNIRLKPIKKIQVDGLNQKAMDNQQIIANKIDRSNRVKKQQKQSIESVKKIQAFEQMSNFNAKKSNQFQKSKTIDTIVNNQKKQQQQAKTKKQLLFKNNQKQQTIQKIKVCQQPSPMHTSQTFMPD